MPDVDVRFLQDFLGDRPVPHDTQCDRVQMRAGLPVELLECALVGQRHPREQRGKPRVAIADRVAGRLGSSAGFAARAVLLPQHVGRIAGSIQRAREHEQQVGQPVEVDAARLRDRVVRCASATTRALGAPADGARDMRQALPAAFRPGRMNSFSGGRSAL